MKITYLGSGKFGLECLNALAQSSHSLDLIVTQPPHGAGRGRKQTPTPVARWAVSHSIPFIETDNVNAPQAIEKIAAYQPDVIVVVAFGQKIGNQLINLPPKGAINVHASLLPKYRGAAPINWAIIKGEKQTGISIISLAERMDAGDILAQATTDIGADEAASELHDRLAKIAAPLLIRTIDHIADGTAVYGRQDHSKATLAPKLKKSDGFLNFKEPAEMLQRKIQGFWPWPGASAIYISKKTKKPLRITIAMAEVVSTSNPADLPPGTLDENLNVICGCDALKIIKIKPTGSRLMRFRDFVNGHQTKAGDSFIKIEQ
ncbi:MAG: methionyl-tRNA formyltransferase [Phycisphaerae bacterium]|nr:methionyl-tRNA formyltransferase [Phycisphaerae bacterium]NIP52384.1 methionyl-tRNA formyltransferase [Phycisphaerae bacterium]NIS51380.1 methionyl-tRNA formyltransferase [Phycisphaerae bacterium]NIU08995.1 methionyl-tRNA formyltransferase [Phycisphaerae bacterium]NIU56655.1 methionyl-tRNA formyltransferase [Phycisphaerae bacterium]